MSKKNKKRTIDYFNMTPEEQMANAEMFHDVETGEINFLDALNCKLPNAPVAQSDYTRQIEQACLSEMKKNEKKEDEAYISIIDDVINNNSNHEDYRDIKFNNDENDTVNTDDVEYESEDYPYSSMDMDTLADIYREDVDDSFDDETTKTSFQQPYEKQVTGNAVAPAPANVVETYIPSSNESTINLSKVRCYFNRITGRMHIDDGLISTPISVVATSSIDINPDMIPMDNDRLGEVMSKLLYFIISCKHPTIIMSEDTFEIEFSPYSKLDSKFVFFKNEGFVYAYIIEAEDIDNFYDVIDVFDMNDTDTLRYVIGAAFASNTVHNSFMYNDLDEVEAIMNERHDVKEFMKFVDNDPGTEYSGHNAAGDVLTRLNVPDLQKMTEDVYSLLDELTDTDDEDDEDGEDVDNDAVEYDDDDIDVTDYPDDDSDDLSTESDDINQMFDELESEDSTDEEIHSIEKVETNDSDSDMVLPVVRRQ